MNTTAPYGPPATLRAPLIGDRIRDDDGRVWRIGSFGTIGAAIDPEGGGDRRYILRRDIGPDERSKFVLLERADA